MKTIKEIISRGYIYPEELTAFGGWEGYNEELLKIILREREEDIIENRFEILDL